MSFACASNHKRHRKRSCRSRRGRMVSQQRQCLVPIMPMAVAYNCSYCNLGGGCCCGSTYCYGSPYSVWCPVCDSYCERCGGVKEEYTSKYRTKCRADNAGCGEHAGEGCSCAVCKAEGQSPRTDRKDKCDSKCICSSGRCEDRGCDCGCGCDGGRPDRQLNSQIYGCRCRGNYTCRCKDNVCRRGANSFDDTRGLESGGTHRGSSRNSRRSESRLQDRYTCDCGCRCTKYRCKCDCECVCTDKCDCIGCRCKWVDGESPSTDRKDKCDSKCICSSGKCEDRGCDCGCGCDGGKPKEEPKKPDKYACDCVCSCTKYECKCACKCELTCSDKCVCTDGGCYSGGCPCGCGCQGIADGQSPRTHGRGKCDAKCICGGGKECGCGCHGGKPKEEPRSSCKGVKYQCECGCKSVPGTCSDKCVCNDGRCFIKGCSCGCRCPGDDSAPTNECSCNCKCNKGDKKCEGGGCRCKKGLADGEKCGCGCSCVGGQVGRCKCVGGSDGCAEVCLCQYGDCLEDGCNCGCQCVGGDGCYCDCKCKGGDSHCVIPCKCSDEGGCTKSGCNCGCGCKGIENKMVPERKIIDILQSSEKSESIEPPTCKCENGCRNCGEGCDEQCPQAMAIIMKQEQGTADDVIKCKHCGYCPLCGDSDDCLPDLRIDLQPVGRTPSLETSASRWTSRRVTTRYISSSHSSVSDINVEPNVPPLEPLIEHKPVVLSKVTTHIDIYGTPIVKQRSVGFKIGDSPSRTSSSPSESSDSEEQTTGESPPAFIPGSPMRDIRLTQNTYRTVKKFIKGSSQSYPVIMLAIPRFRRCGAINKMWHNANLRVHAMLHETVPPAEKFNDSSSCGCNTKTVHAIEIKWPPLSPHVRGKSPGHDDLRVLGGFGVVWETYVDLKMLYLGKDPVNHDEIYSACLPRVPSYESFLKNVREFRRGISDYQGKQSLNQLKSRVDAMDLNKYTFTVRVAPFEERVRGKEDVILGEGLSKIPCNKLIDKNDQYYDGEKIVSRWDSIPEDVDVDLRGGAYYQLQWPAVRDAKDRATVYSLRDGCLQEGSVLFGLGVVIKFIVRAKSSWFKSKPFLKYFNEIEGKWQELDFVINRCKDDLNHFICHINHVKRALFVIGDRTNPNKWLKTINNYDFMVAFSGCYEVFDNGRIIQTSNTMPVIDRGSTNQEVIIDAFTQEQRAQRASSFIDSFEDSLDNEVISWTSETQRDRMKVEEVEFVEEVVHGSPREDSGEGIPQVEGSSRGSPSSRLDGSPSSRLDGSPKGSPSSRLDGSPRIRSSQDVSVELRKTTTEESGLQVFDLD